MRRSVGAKDAGWLLLSCPCAVLCFGHLFSESIYYSIYTLYLSQAPFLPPRALPAVVNRFMPLYFDAYNLGGGRILPAEHPHENKLHHIAVKEEELCSPVSLRAVDGLHAACW